MIKDKKSDKKFFKDLTSTQMFQMFLQNSLFNNNEKKAYFQDTLKDYLQYKSNGYGTSYIYSKIFEKLKKEYLSFFEITKNFIIKPFFIKDFKAFEDEYIQKNNKNLNLKNLSLYLKKQNQQKLLLDEKNFNVRGILKENKRIIKEPIVLNNDNDPKTIDIYVFPENSIEDELFKSDENQNKKKFNEIRIISEEKDAQEDNIKNTNINNTIIKENDLTEDDKEEIKDNIKEIMTRIYRSDTKKIEEDKKIIIDSVKTQFGLEYFASILNTGNYNNREIKCVTEQAYDLLNEVFLNALKSVPNLEKNENKIYCSMKLIKACLCIKTIKNKKELLLCDNLFHK